VQIRKKRIVKIHPIEHNYSIKTIVLTVVITALVSSGFTYLVVHKSDKDVLKKMSAQAAENDAEWMKPQTKSSGGPTR
jgi:signal recognition particle receptor subunit beta